MASNTTVPATRSTSRGWGARLTSLVGWVLFGCGPGVLAYLVYALLYANVGTERAQTALRRQWERQVAGATPEPGAPSGAGRQLRDRRAPHDPRRALHHLDALRSGDRIRVTDRRGTRYIYEVAETHVVGPADAWVIGEDPLGTGAPTMTLTTCTPRFSAAARLILLARLLS